MDSEGYAFGGCANEGKASPDALLTPPRGMGVREFVACIAMMQATVALAIDMMVPALGQIGAAMHLAAANQRQWVITAFMLGFAFQRRWLRFCSRSQSTGSDGSG